MEIFFAAKPVVADRVRTAVTYASELWHFRERRQATSRHSVYMKDDVRVLISNNSYDFVSTLGLQLNFDSTSTARLLCSQVQHRAVTHSSLTRFSGQMTAGN